MTHPVDPVNLAPIPPLIDSYTYHSAPHQDDGPEGWIMGIDEAGRGRELLEGTSSCAIARPGIGVAVASGAVL